MEESPILIQARQLLEEDKKKREEGFNQELLELKKKWGVDQHPTIDNSVVNNIIEALTKSKIIIATKAQ